MWPFKKRSIIDKMVFCGNCRFCHRLTMASTDETLVCEAPSEAVMTKTFYEPTFRSCTKCMEKNKNNDCKQWKAKRRSQY